MSTTWLENNRANFSVVDIDGKSILVCTKNVGSFKVVFVEDIRTGKRIFNDKPASSLTSWGRDDLIKELASQL